jgi:hypothetical protein
MNIKTLFQVLKSVTELAGIVAIFISLLFVLQELHQARQIALGEFDMLYTQNRIMANQQQALYADVWVRGCAGDSLSTAEAAIFQRLVNTENDLAVY